MNKLFKGLICYTIAICCHILCFAHSATENDSPLSVKLSPEKEIYYIGETVGIIFTLKIDEENAVLEDINLAGLSNLPYAKVSQIYQDPSKEEEENEFIFVSSITFTEAISTQLNIDATYRYSIRDVRGNGFFVMKTMGPTKRAKASSKAFIVKELPPPPTEPFTGFIGEIDIYSTLSTNEATVGDIVTIRTEIITSDISQSDITPCSIDHIDGFKLYPAKIVDEEKGESESRYIIEQNIVPNVVGQFTIPSPKVFSFDTMDGTYKQSADNDPLEITVTERKVEAVEDIVLDPSANIENSKTNDVDSTTKPLDPATAKCITTANTTAKLAPATTALTIFEIPANSSITILEQHDAWYRVRYKDSFGWIPITSTTGGK